MSIKQFEETLLAEIYVVKTQKENRFTALFLSNGIKVKFPNY